MSCAGDSCVCFGNYDMLSGDAVASCLNPGYTKAPQRTCAQFQHNHEIVQHEAGCEYAQYPKHIPEYSQNRRDNTFNVRPATSAGSEPQDHSSIMSETELRERRSTASEDRSSENRSTIRQVKFLEPRPGTSEAESSEPPKNTQSSYQSAFQIRDCSRREAVRQNDSLMIRRGQFSQVSSYQTDYLPVDPSTIEALSKVKPIRPKDNLVVGESQMLGTFFRIDTEGPHVCTDRKARFVQTEPSQLTQI